MSSELRSRIAALEARLASLPLPAERVAYKRCLEELQVCRTQLLRFENRQPGQAAAEPQAPRSVVTAAPQEPQTATRAQAPDTWRSIAFLDPERGPGEPRADAPAEQVPVIPPQPPTGGVAGARDPGPPAPAGGWQSISFFEPEPPAPEPPTPQPAAPQPVVTAPSPEALRSAPYQVFVSFSSEDRAFAEKEVIDVLHQHGIRTWSYIHDIDPAQVWDDEIVRGLEACPWFVVVLSPRAGTSKWVQNEVHWAYDHRKGRLVPVLLEPYSQVSSLSFKLQRIQHIDFTRDRERARQRLLETLRAPLPASEAEHD